MISNCQNIAILGAQESGLGAALLACKKGYNVWVSDYNAILDHYKQELDSNGIDYEEYGHDQAKILSADYIVKSPGISPQAPIVQAAYKMGVPVISEIEFASRHTDAKIIAITGSNGKTTTTSLTYNVFSKAGKNVACAGNIGESFARSLAREEADIYVLEISSFQLDDIQLFKPHVAVLLNITPDHLDRYDDKFENYIESKFRITMNQDSGDYFIYNMEDSTIENALKEKNIHAQCLGMSIAPNADATASVQEKSIIVNHKNIFKMNLAELGLSGQHNVYNSMAASITGKIFDIKKEVIRESLSDFKSLEHRLEFVAKVKGVEYINDSKATNVNSSWYALETVQNPIVWIVGGIDKGNDYEILQELVKQKVKTIICLGQDNIKIHEAFSKYVDLIINTYSMEEAVSVANHFSSKGDAVVLSPACASFDLFDNYEHRGRCFKAAVREL